MGSSETSLGVKAECLELLGHLADVPQCLPILVSDGILRPLIALLKLPDAAVEASAAELLAKLLVAHGRVEVDRHKVGGPRLGRSMRRLRGLAIARKMRS